MNSAGKLFRIGLRQFMRDGMLLILLPAPFLMGAALHILLPLADSIFLQKLEFTIKPWFLLSDSFLITMTPMFTAMICAFLILDERDEGIGTYYAVTPAAGGSYLMARLGYPMMWAFVVSILVRYIFGLTVGSLPVILLAALVSTLLGVASCMLLVSFAGNKVEGLALSKLTGLIAMGLPAVWFLESPYKYGLSFLPSFWLGELIMASADTTPMIAYAIIGILCAVMWIAVFVQRFMRRAGL